MVLIFGVAVVYISVQASSDDKQKKADWKRGERWEEEWADNIWQIGEQPGSNSRAAARFNISLLSGSSRQIHTYSDHNLSFRHIPADV